jgi:hypothetical protein
VPGGPDTEPLTSLDRHWRDRGIHCEYFVFDPEQSDTELVIAFQEQIKQHCGSRAASASDLIIGGFSRGARIAALLAQSETFAAMLGLSYPFHKHGQPQERHGLAALQELTLPTLLVQGTRDAHGNREQVRGYGALPSNLQLHWLEEGNHRWRVPERSHADAEDLLRSAAAATTDFLRRTLPSVPHA